MEGVAFFMSDTESEDAREKLVGYIGDLLRLGVDAMYTVTYPRILKNTILLVKE